MKENMRISGVEERLIMDSTEEINYDGKTKEEKMGKEKRKIMRRWRNRRIQVKLEFEAQIN